jgi:hypothetical protein
MSKVTKIMLQLNVFHGVRIKGVLMGINKEQLIYDETDLESSDQVGANILGTSGAKVSSTTVSGKEALDVFSVDKVDWDEIATTFPSITTELYTYKKNSVTVQTILVTYLDNTKKTIVSLNKTRI